MNPLEIIIAAFPGTLREALNELLKKLAEIRDATGMIPEERLHDAVAWVAEKANYAVSDEVILAGLMELLDVVQGNNWGPPNDGAGGVA